MMSDLGIKVLPQTQAHRLLGSERIEGVELSNGQCLKADLCLLAAGIKPSTVKSWLPKADHFFLIWEALYAVATTPTSRNVLKGDDIRNQGK